MNSVLALKKPDSSEYDPYYEPYMSLVTESDVIQAMHGQIAEFDSLLAIEDERATVVDAPYSWTIKQVVGHVIDNERVFGYRAARFAAGDTTNLAGYEQNDFVANMDYQSPRLQELVDELRHVRKANLLMFQRFSPEAWDFRGQSDGKSLTVRAIACLQVAHLRHHLNIVKQRLVDD